MILTITEYQYILNSIMDNLNFTKSFSKGQITIPKKIRQKLGLTGDFWLRLYTEGRKIIAEPVDQPKVDSGYSAKLLSIGGAWFDQAAFNKTRDEIEHKLRINK